MRTHTLSDITPTPASPHSSTTGHDDTMNTETWLNLALTRIETEKNTPPAPGAPYNAAI